MSDVEHPALPFLDAMWGATPGAWSTLGHRPDGSSDLVHAAVGTDDRDAWAQWLAEHEGTDCYFRVCPMGSRPDTPFRRGVAADSTAVPGLWADIDVRSAKHPKAPEAEDVRKRLRMLDQHVRLSLVVNTGNGWQVYVPFDERGRRHAGPLGQAVEEPGPDRRPQGRAGLVDAAPRHAQHQRR
jgi:hypothetical protein